MRILLVALSVLAVLGLGSTAQTSPLVVYTYDSFVSFGPAKTIETRFEKAFDVDVQFVATSDSRAMLARLLNEHAAGNTPADVFIGVEANDLATATQQSVFAPLETTHIPNLAQVPTEIRFDPQNRLLPYEHGFITLVYDADQIDEQNLPQTFEQLAEPRFANQLVVQDPRTSSPGLSFLLWTIHRFGDPGYLDYWRRLLPNLLTITPGWSEAFGLFVEGEAPMMVSFSTDHAFDVIVNGSDRIRVLLLNNQGYRTIFGAGVVNTSDQPQLARQFVNFLLSEETQSLLPTSEWMFPANPKALLPVPFYQNAVRPPLSAQLDSQQVGDNLARWLRQWAEVVIGGN